MTRSHQELLEDAERIFSEKGRYEKRELYPIFGREKLQSVLNIMLDMIRLDKDTKEWSMNYSCEYKKRDPDQEPVYIKEFFQFFNVYIKMEMTPEELDKLYEFQKTQEVDFYRTELIPEEYHSVISKFIKYAEEYYEEDPHFNINLREPIIRLLRDNEDFFHRDVINDFRGWDELNLLDKGRPDVIVVRAIWNTFSNNLLPEDEGYAELISTDFRKCNIVHHLFNHLIRCHQNRTLPPKTNMKSARRSISPPYSPAHIPR